MSDGPYFSTPEEANESVRKQMEEAKANFVDFQHRMVQMLDHMSSEDLEVFAQFAMGCVGNGHTALFYHGFATAMRSQKYGVCAGCGEDHDAVLAKIMDEGRLLPDAQTSFDAVQVVGDSENLMELYLIEPNPEYPDENPSHPVRCSNCYMGYVSLEDRMVKEPGTAGCQGCALKEKWG